MKKKIKKYKSSIALTIIGLLLTVIVIIIITLRFSARNIGAELGSDLGKVVGKAIGSFDGYIDGRKEGIEAGKTSGLSAEDTEVEIIEEIQRVNNLEVLVASVKVNDIHSIGKDVEYMALYLLKGEVVFSVDLSQAAVKLEDNELFIRLPLPKGKLIINQSQVEKVAEYQKHFFSGDAESGFNAYLNSMIKVQEATAETLDNYDTLIEAAKESAIKQVGQLASSAMATKRHVTISFIEEENNNG